MKMYMNYSILCFLIILKLVFSAKFAVHTPSGLGGPVERTVGPFVHQQHSDYSEHSYKCTQESFSCFDPSLMILSSLALPQHSTTGAYAVDTVSGSVVSLQLDGAALPEAVSLPTTVIASLCRSATTVSTNNVLNNSFIACFRSIDQDYAAADDNVLVWRAPDVPLRGFDFLRTSGAAWAAWAGRGAEGQVVLRAHGLSDEISVNTGITGGINYVKFLTESLLVVGDRNSELGVVRVDYELRTAERILDLEPFDGNLFYSHPTIVTTDSTSQTSFTSYSLLDNDTTCAGRGAVLALLAPHTLLLDALATYSLRTCTLVHPPSPARSLRHPASAVARSGTIVAIDGGTVDVWADCAHQSALAVAGACVACHGGGSGSSGCWGGRWGCPKHTYSGSDGQCVADAGFRVLDAATAAPVVAPCPPGHACAAGTVHPCTAGTVPTHDAAACTPCYGHRVTGAVDGVVVGITCQPCPAGTFAQNNICTECPVGSACEGGESLPRPCPPGSYQPNEGQTHCIDIPSGFYLSPDGHLLPCPPGHACTAGHLLPCPPGTYQPGEGSDHCDRVLDGYELTTSTSAPLPCPSGHYCQGGIRRPCHAPFYQPAPGATACLFCAPPAQATPTTCTPCTTGPGCPLVCPANTVLSGGACRGLPGYTSTGEACPTGHYCPSGEPIACHPGHMCPQGSVAASPCTTGTYQSLAAQETCLPCPIQQSPNQPLAATACAACPPDSLPTFGGCLPCPAGWHAAYDRCALDEDYYVDVKLVDPRALPPATRLSERGKRGGDDQVTYMLMLIQALIFLILYYL